MPKSKLELTWIGKEIRSQLEPRILIEDPEKSCHAKYRIKKFTTEITEDTEKKGNSVSSSVNAVPSVMNPLGDLFDNKLIFGDNLLAKNTLDYSIRKSGWMQVEVMMRASKHQNEEY